jgi:ribosomal protein S18 acetylase RimI-like enzyme
VGDYTIREAESSDFGEILALWASIERHTALPDTLEYLQTLHDFSPGLFLVAEDAGGRIIGTIIGGWDGWRGHMARLATHPDVRRRGIAEALVREAERRLRERGARRIYALVDRRSAPAMPFWESAGYRANEDIVQYSRNVEEE